MCIRDRGCFQFAAWSTPTPVQGSQIGQLKSWSPRHFAQPKQMMVTDGSIQTQGGPGEQQYAIQQSHAPTPANMIFGMSQDAQREPAQGQNPIIFSELAGQSWPTQQQHGQHHGQQHGQYHVGAGQHQQQHGHNGGGQHGHYGQQHHMQQQQQNAQQHGQHHGQYGQMFAQHQQGQQHGQQHGQPHGQQHGQHHHQNDGQIFSQHGQHGQQHGGQHGQHHGGQHGHHSRGTCLLYTSPSPRDRTRSRMPSSA
eukprot:TRINITY_DN2311_c0_g1_i1.p1 TRINITY_DN2311_c0_g1~~TRINITY_DN2311_c0_g1_i1.p1  ORF type:complete len:252 (+),score=63.42 TRINITY_DN2311_c0_g1_i1:129-884(+)